MFHKASALRPLCFITTNLPLQTVHGGITALTFDNMLGWALFLQGTGAVFTASLKVTHQAMNTTLLYMFAFGDVGVRGKWFMYTSASQTSLRPLPESIKVFLHWCCGTCQAISHVSSGSSRACRAPCAAITPWMMIDYVVERCSTSSIVTNQSFYTARSVLLDGVIYC